MLPLSKNLAQLVASIQNCRVCEAYLPLPPNPVLKVHQSAKLLIVGQAPGTRVHMTGIPWNDPSGDRLRAWINLDRKIFYQNPKIAIIPMGLCYPGRGKSGDLPPRKECAALWLNQLLAQLPDIQLTLLVGQYAQAHYLGETMQKTLTETVKAWNSYLPRYFPLPHPSPRNNIWLRKNSWFEKEVIPALKQAVHKVL